LCYQFLMTMRLYIKFLPVFATAGKYIKCLILLDGSKLLKIVSQTSHIGKWNYVEIVLSMVEERGLSVYLTFMLTFLTAISLGEGQ
jgi:chromosome condensin MukBEF MukE localization factor